MINGLSILIPAFETDIRQLVNDLSQQAQDFGCPFEIIVREDGQHSYLEKNAEILTIPYVKHIKAKHVGRAKGRNELAKMAQHHWLLFLDADSEITSKNYLKNWIPFFKTNQLTSGGRIYAPEMPKEIAFQLHWKWGTARELVDENKRNTMPENCFLSNNFVVEKQVIQRIPFNENLVGYGYEDTLFAFDLKENGILIHHTQNPVVHLGLDDTHALLQKIEEAMQNLLKIKKMYASNNQTLPLKSKLIGLLIWLRFYTVRQILIAAHENVKSQLLKPNPSLFWFDLYRLTTLSKLIQKDLKQTIF